MCDASSWSDSKPKTLNPNPETRNPSPKTLNPKPETLKVIFKNLTRVDPHLCVEFVAERLMRAMNKGGEQGLCSPQVETPNPKP